MNKILKNSIIALSIFCANIGFERLAVANTEILQGVWAQECKTKKQKQEEFSGNKVTLRELYFSGQDCSGEIILEVASTGEYFLDAEKMENMDFRFESVLFIPRVSAIANQFNQKQLCGFTDWTVSQAKDVSGLVCDLFPPAKPLKVPSNGEMRYGIYSIDANKLYLGKLTREWNATRPELRPRELELNPFIKAAR